MLEGRDTFTTGSIDMAAESLFMLYRNLLNTNACSTRISAPVLQKSTIELLPERSNNDLPSRRWLSLIRIKVSGSTKEHVIFHTNDR